MLKYLCKANNFNEKQSLVWLLQDNGIECISKTKGASIMSRDPDRVFWFKLYVKKSDYKKALDLINQKQ